STARKNHRRNQTHATCKQNEGRRAYSAHAKPGCEDHVWHGSTTQSERADADRARRTQATGLREDGIEFDHEQDPPPAAGRPGCSNSSREPAKLNPGKDRSE